MVLGPLQASRPGAVLQNKMIVICIMGFLWKS